MKVILKCIFLLLISNFAFAQESFLAGVRSNAALVEQKAIAQKVDFLQQSAEEFANGNTFVRLTKDVQMAKIDLILPRSLTANDLMEALLTVFTLKKNGAYQVRLVLETETPAVQISDLNETVSIEKWFQAAGADRLVLASRERPLKKSKTASSPQVGQETALYGVNHPSLLNEMAGLMKIPVIKELNRASIKGMSMKLVAPSPEPVNLNFFRTLLVGQKMQALGAANVELITPYLPYARSDKVDQSGVAVAGKLIANLIEMSGFTSVSFVRSHAPQSEGFFQIPTKNISGRDTINHYLQSLNVEAVISPDAGFQKDATLYAEELKIPVAVINKQRDPVTSKTKIVGISGIDVSGKVVAILDDETASGGTLGKAAEYLKELGARKVFTVVTHLTGDAKGALESPAVERVVVTDTLPIQISHEKLAVLSIAAEIAKSSVPASRAVRMCQAAHQSSAGK